MNDEVRYQIYDYIKKYFYYIEYPDGVGEGFWKDADGKHHSIMFMTIEHLQECIKRIDKDIHRFEGALLDEIQEQALAAILLLANQIRNDLEEELEYQKNEEKDRQERDLLERRKRFEREETEELEYDGELSWEEPEQDAPDPLKTESVTMELPKWMIDKLKAEGEIGAVVERCVKKVGFKYEQKNEKPENEKPENVKPERRGVKEAVTEEAIKQVLKTSINSVQGFVQLALSYNWPKETMVRYLKLIEKTSQRMKKEIGKLQEK
ncbi:MAG: hypothetical protein GY749_09305 [Desulfobacteraceae bacterium]|nr:hypothetical protein [Desulfobacteraceae bacterium]